MPAHDPLDAVQVFEEFPQEPRFARARFPDHRHQAGPAVLRALLEGVGHLGQLAFTSDERRLEPGAAAGPARAGDDLQCRPRVHGLLAPFDHVLAGILVGDRGFTRAPRHVIDEHRARRRDRLQSARRVDRVTEHHPLALSADIHRRVTGQHPRADAQLGHSDLLAQQRHRARQRQRGSDRAFGVVLARDRRAPDGHHRVADELLDRAAVALDQRSAAVEVTRQQLADLLGIAMLAQRREADQVREQHRYQSPLGARRSGLDSAAVGRRGHGHGIERSAAVAAEPVGRLVDAAAVTAVDRERCPALSAESSPGSVLRSARRARMHKYLARGILSLRLALPSARAIDCPRPWKVAG